MDSIIIIGAGAAGLSAARKISEAGKTVTVLEARTRIGGRIFTAHEKDFSMLIETGAEFIHGDLPLTKSLAKAAEATLQKGEGQNWNLEEGIPSEGDSFEAGWDELLHELKKLEHDVSIGEFLRTHFAAPQYDSLRESVIRFVQGFDAADPDKASAFGLREEWTNSDDDALTGYHIQNGYSHLMNFLQQECLKQSVSFYLSRTVTEIQWEEGRVTVKTSSGEEFTADKVLITIPPAVLQKGSVKFSPEIPLHNDAIQKIETGGVIKFIIEFTEPIWEKESCTTFREFPNLHFLFTDAYVPTWWTQKPSRSPILTGWLSGPITKTISKTEAELEQDAVQSLAYIFGSSEEALRARIVAIKVINWANDPFSYGAYAYKAIGTEEALHILSQPILNTIYFAGEAYYKGTEMGTVEAALASGEARTKEILSGS
ncbi:MAG TPA: NAD(P)/FAD-dependent oxidoreductase [Ohtaekwangia sp.]